MNDLRNQIAFSAGSINKVDLINESVSFEKRKINIKVRALDTISSILNNVEDLKREITNPYRPYYGPGPAPVVTQNDNPPEEQVVLKNIVYNILKDKMKVVLATIEKEFGAAKKDDDEDEHEEW